MRTILMKLTLPFVMAWMKALDVRMVAINDNLTVTKTIKGGN